MTGDSGIVTGDSGKAPEIGHDKTESVVTIARNRRSRSNGMGGHDGPEYAVTSEKGHHALRHTFATRASEKNIDLKTIQRWLGHASIATTMIYVHSTEEHLESAAKLLD